MSGIMKLTVQMRNEMTAINERIHELWLAAFTNFPRNDNYDRIKRVYHEEIIAHKVKLEIFFSETDIKEQVNSYSREFLLLITRFELRKSKKK